MFYNITYINWLLGTEDVSTSVMQCALGPPAIVNCCNGCTVSDACSVPALSVEEYKGISDSSKERLLAELARLAKDCVGEVMMFQLVQHTQQFLDHNDQTMLPSLYEQMVQREQRREDERKRQSEREQETQQERIEKEVCLQLVVLQCHPNWVVPPIQIEEAFKQRAEQRRKGSGMSKQVRASQAAWLVLIIW